MAKKFNDQAKILVVAKERLISISTDEIHEKGSAYYVNPEIAELLLELGLVELSKETHTAEIISEEK